MRILFMKIFSLQPNFNIKYGVSENAINSNKYINSKGKTSLAVFLKFSNQMDASDEMSLC